jgi:hypothetical protein
LATKRADIESLVGASMENRGIAAARPPEPRKRQVQIRFDPGDYEALQRIARRKGTKAAALVRQLAKEYIEAESGV